MPGVMIFRVTPIIEAVEKFRICRGFMPEEGLEPPTRGL